MSLTLPALIHHGSLPLEVEPEDLMVRPRGLDSTTQVWLTDREDTFHNGGPLPRRPFMFAKEVQTKQVGNAFHHRVQGEGLARGADKLEQPVFRQPPEGWDEGMQDVLTLSPDQWVIGRVHPTIPTMWCVGLGTKEAVNDKVWRISPDWRGIILDGSGNPKPATWKVTVNGQNINSSSSITLGSVTPEVFTDEDGVWNGWASARKASFDVSKLNLVKTMLSTTPPPTERVGLSLTPEYIPAQFNIFDDVRWVAASFTYNYPSSCFKLAGVQSERVLDKELYLYTLTYEYNPLFIPTF